MKTISAAVSQGTKFLADNSPLILTGLGALGVVTTAVFSSKATQVALDKIRAEEEKIQRPLSTPDKVSLVWLNYLPAAASGALSITAIIFASRISASRAAAVAGALTVVNKDFEDYKAKALEKLGVAKEQKLRDEMASDKVKKLGDTSKIVIMGGVEDVLCYDVFSDTPFQSSMNKLKAAELDMQHQMLADDYVLLADWYVAVGMSPPQFAYSLGWDYDNTFGVDITATETEDHRPCFAVTFPRAPEARRKSKR